MCIGVNVSVCNIVAPKPMFSCVFFLHVPGEELGLIESQEIKENHASNSSSEWSTLERGLITMDRQRRSTEVEDRSPDEQGSDDDGSSGFALGLVKSNSVVARASMWQQLQQQAKGRSVLNGVLKGRMLGVVGFLLHHFKTFTKLLCELKVCLNICTFLGFDWESQWEDSTLVYSGVTKTQVIKKMFRRT